MSILFSIVCGFYFAMVQFSYFFLMEAHLSSQYLAYFVVLCFWLLGFWAGLAVRDGRFPLCLAVGLASYYAAWLLVRWIPFHTMLYPCSAVCAMLSGLSPGCFFPLMARRFARVRHLFFHENNGFILGIAVALKASIDCGSWFLAWGPLIAALPVAITFLVSRKRRLAALPASG